MPDTMRRAAVTLLYKKGDASLLKNYRPISLSNYDYKILAFALSKRLQTVISKLISPDQTAYINARYIGNNSRFIQDIIDYTEDNNIPGALISLDFEKAFDSLQWDFMLKCLEKYNFGNNFLRWIKILYNTPNMIIKNNGYFSREVKMSAGIRQGCPISALLFILSVEVMASQIKSNNNIKGITCDNVEYKISQYADDSNLLIADINSIEYAINIVKNFSAVAGPKLNMLKTEGLWLGPLKDCDIYNVHEVKFKTNPLKCLGLYVGYNKDECEKCNWIKKLEYFDNTLLNWKRRKLTLFGKVIVINSLAISKLIYHFTVLYVPTWVITHLEKSIINFLWNSHNRINRNCLISKIECGGINLVDVRSKIMALKATWISKWISNDKLAWKNIANHRLHKIGLNIDLVLKFTIKGIENLSCLKLLPIFYQDILLSYISCKSNKPIERMNSFDFFSMPIWGNQLFMVRNECLLYKNWINVNIVYVKDLFDENSHFLSELSVFNRLIVKRNWIIEYSTIKRLVNKYINKYTFDVKLAKYVQIHNDYRLFDGNKRVDIRNVKSEFYYSILINKKSTPHFMRKSWCKLFKISLLNEDWVHIYKRKVKTVPYKKLAEFNYKLIHGTITPGYIINKWNKSIPSVCILCSNNDTTFHMLFLCPRIRNIWLSIGEILQIDIKWKDIVLGLNDNNTINIARNNIFTVLAFAIYSTWVKHHQPDQQTAYSEVGIQRCVISYLLMYKSIFKNFKYPRKWFSIFERYTTKIITTLNSS